MKTHRLVCHSTLGLRVIQAAPHTPRPPGQGDHFFWEVHVPFKVQGLIGAAISGFQKFREFKGFEGFRVAKSTLRRARNLFSRACGI